VFTVNEKAVTSTVPAGPSGVSADVDCGAPPHVPFRNQSTVTLPVGAGLPAPPLTVTKSCTVEPTPTAVTTAWAALWMSVVVVEGSPVITVGEPAPTFRGFGLQFEFLSQSDRWGVVPGELGRVGEDVTPEAEVRRWTV
jgi:hypothetical protein